MDVILLPWSYINNQISSDEMMTVICSPVGTVFSEMDCVPLTGFNLTSIKNGNRTEINVCLKGKKTFRNRSL